MLRFTTMSLKKREEAIIEQKLRKEIPSIQPAGRGYVFREFEMQKLFNFIYDCMISAELKGRESAKKTLENKLKRIIEKELT